MSLICEEEEVRSFVLPHLALPEYRTQYSPPLSVPRATLLSFPLLLVGMAEVASAGQGGGVSGGLLGVPPTPSPARDFGAPEPGRQGEGRGEAAEHHFLVHDGERWRFW